MTKEQYELTKTRLEKGKDYLKDKWLDPKFEKYVDEYNRLADEVLHYEMENDLLPLFSNPNSLAG